MRNDYILDTLISVDIQEFGKSGGKNIRIYGGVIYRENSKRSLFRKHMEILFSLIQNIKMKETI